MEFDNIPLGFSMALAQNTPALEKFGQLSEPERQSVIRKAHNVHSKQEMRQLVSGIGDN